MNHKRNDLVKWIGSLPLSLVLAVSNHLAVSAQDHGHPHEADFSEKQLKIDKNGEMDLPSDMKVQDAVLPKGRYLVRHRIEGQDHWFDFEPVRGEKNAVEPSRPLAARARSIRTQERNKNSAAYASLDDHDYRIVKVQLAGERMEYLF
jgi:hypothetical protein